MLVLSREACESVMVNGPDGDCLLTILRVGANDVSLLVSHAPPAGGLQSWTVTLTRDMTFKVDTVAEVTLVDIRDVKARIGINSSRQAMVHRLEIYEAIKRENRRAAGGDPEDGLAGTPVPRPDKPKPPTLGERLNEPPAADGGGE